MGFVSTILSDVFTQPSSANRESFVTIPLASERNLSAKKDYELAFSGTR
jgi:hypothetical protein